MGTSYEVKIAGQLSAAQREALRDAIPEILDDLDAKMSTWKSDSELSRFNRAMPNSWFEVSAETAAVAARASQISTMSDGFFDPSVAPLLALWGFGAQAAPRTPPRPAAVAAACARVGRHKWRVRLTPPALMKNIDLNLDFSAIAKGYAVDQIAQLLQTEGVENYLVEIGGELRVAGRARRDRAWRIGVVDPSAPGMAKRAIIARQAMAVATSGDYNLYYEMDGRRYSHTIDPGRCRPARHRLASVTVVAPSAADADAMATALHAMGEERGLHFANRRGIAAYFLVRTEDESLQERASDAFTPYLALE